MNTIPNYYSLLMPIMVEPLSVVYYVLSVGPRGKRVTFGQALRKNVGKILVNLTLGQGLFQLLIPGQRQAIQDQFAHCYVVKLPKP